MKRFRYHLKEEKRVPWHITFGRGNPFHEMHSQLGQHVKNAADEEGAGHTVVLSGTHGDIKNPLTPEQKLKHAQRAMPGVNVVVADKSAPTLLHQAANLHNNGVTDLNVHVGSDRVDEFQNLLIMEIMKRLFITLRISMFFHSVMIVLMTTKEQLDSLHQK